MDSKITLEEPYRSKFELEVLSEAELMQTIRQNNNVIKETSIVLRAVKE